ncbi:MAG TPA: Rnf-Nqr domain containing protein [Spongiibacteraceae bacterium]|nr:Rnf-Nqr domain containing protein [Spongiibacteraceae bacterium]
MPNQLSLPLIAALLLSIAVIAPALGQRAPKNLDETLGLGVCTALTLVKAAIIIWVITQYVLQPLGLIFLNIIIATLVIATIAYLVENRLHSRYQKFFPVQGNLLPQIIANVIILMLPLMRTGAIGFFSYLGRALSFGIGAAILLALFQILREHSASAQIPQPLRGPAIDMISAGLIVAALSGLTGIF